MNERFVLDVSDPPTIGIVGGGQLGKMLAQEAKRMSLDVVILDPDPNCPARLVVDKQIVSDLYNEDALRTLAESSDIITYEIEHTNSDALMMLEKEGYKLSPSPYTLKIIQDKLLQKRVLKENNLPVPRFEEVDSKESILRAIDRLGYPAVLKSRKGSYDGRGNFVIRDSKDIEEALRFMNNRPCYIEEFVPFYKEVSIMIAKNEDGIIKAFPLAENIHRDNILHMTIVPARVNESIKVEALRVAENTVRVLKGAGIFGIEMFVLDSKVMINEIAPRPHNSGHYTIEACTISQFEMHIRAILNLPLPTPLLLSPVVMINILGEEGCDGEYIINGIEDVLSLTGVKLHIYGKKTSRKGRKLGHITVLDRDVESAIIKAEKARSMLKIINKTHVN